MAERKVSLPDDHDISECWNPHYHKSPFKNDLAKIFEVWYRKQYTHMPILRAAPLCVFGGVQFTVYTAHEHASGGTYAVCPKCKTVMICGYGDNEKPNPNNCEKCDTLLDFNNYFQPVSQGSRVNEKDVIDTKCDPAVTVAETCAYAKEGIPCLDLYPIIAILKNEGLLQTAHFVDDFSIRDNLVESQKIRNRISAGSESLWAHIEPCTPHFNVVTTKRGEMMLKAKKITRCKATRERIVFLLNNPRKLFELSLMAVAKSLTRAK